MKIKYRIKKIIRAILILWSFLFLLVPISRAENEQWIFKNISGYSYFSKNKIDQTGKYILFNGNSTYTYFSNNYGETWTPIGDSGYRGLIEMSLSGKYLMIGNDKTSDKLYISTDYGQTWNNITKPETTTKTWNGAISENGEYFYFSTQNQVFKSTDYGQTWNKILETTNYGDNTIIKISNSGKIITFSQAIGNKFYISTDYGQTWNDRSITGANINIVILKNNTIIAISNNNSDVWKSTDYGQNWQAITELNINNLLNINKSNSGKYVIITGKKKIILSTDYGQTWDDITPINFNSSNKFTYTNISGNGKYIYNGIDSYDNKIYLNYNNNRNDEGSTPDTDPEQPTQDDYILYYGDHPYYSQNYTTTYLPIVYNLCKNWQEDTEYYIKAYDIDTNEPITEHQQKLSTCSGSLNFSFVNTLGEAFHRTKFKVNNLNTESNLFWFTSYQAIPENPVLPTPPQEPETMKIGFIEKSPYYINRLYYTDQIPIKIRFFSNLEEEQADNTEICVFNVLNNNVYECLDAPYIAGATYTGEFELLSSQLKDSFYRIKLVLRNKTTNKNILFSNELMIAIHSSMEDFDPEINIFANMNETNFLDILGLNSRSMACSNEEWNDSDTKILGISWNKIWCPTKKLFFDTLFIGPVFVTKLSNITLNLVTDIWPLKIPKEIEKSWLASENQPLPEKWEWLNPKTNLKITIPKKWSGSQEDINIDLISKNEEAIINVPEIKNISDKIRGISTSIIYIVYLMGLISFGFGFYEKYLARETDEEPEMTGYSISYTESSKGHTSTSITGRYKNN